MVWRPAKAWTSQQPVGGYRHFELILQGGRDDQRWVELAALLDPSLRMRVSWLELKDRNRWSSGWQQIAEDDEDSADQ
ncbi:MAG: TIGR02450 family Trp-rich protein [Cyanobacteriota bacterium]|nr:TIGR02450 family Trp-rich protein [Cyanobacteriota bacterium]